jgi:hypothetical protein
MDQIVSLPDAYKARFLQQWNSGGVVGMARGGILTQPTAVLAAEAGDREAWIPINSSLRSGQLLRATAAAMGYQLTPAARYASNASAPAAPGVGAMDVRVFIGDREIRDIVRVEATPLVREAEQRSAYRARVGRR